MRRKEDNQWEDKVVAQATHCSTGVETVLEEPEDLTAKPKGPKDERVLPLLPDTQRTKGSWQSWSGFRP